MFFWCCILKICSRGNSDRLGGISDRLGGISDRLGGISDRQGSIPCPQRIKELMLQFVQPVPAAPLTRLQMQQYIQQYMQQYMQQYIQQYHMLCQRT